MGSKRAVLLFAVFFLAVSFAPISKISAQRMLPKNGSVYGSVGYSMDWFFASSIKVRQEGEGNDYTMSKVKATNAGQTSISALQLSYRLGYFYDYEQTWGVELSFDPVNYRVTDGSIVKVKGTVNNVNVNKAMTFSAANGYYYYYSGTNLFRINLVRRIQLFNNARNNIRVDIMAKGGVGPSLAHAVNNFGTNPLSGPLFEFNGYNAGVEAGIRGTFFRYGYIEIMGRYNLVYMNNLNVYEGSAKHLFQGYGAVASVGFHFPTSRNNPLFRRGKKIITILPFYQQDKQNKEGSNDEGGEMDSTDHNKFRQIPEFEDILDKEAEEAEALELKLHPPDTFNNMDSIAAMENQVFTDSVEMAGSADHVDDSLHSKKGRRRRKREEAKSQKAAQDSLNNTGQVEVNKGNPDDVPPAADNVTAPPPEPVEEKINKKEEKRKAKEEKKEAKRKAKADKAEAKRKAKEEKAAKKKAEQEKKTEEDKPKEETPPEPAQEGN